MNSKEVILVKNALEQKKFNVVNEYAKIIHSDKGELVVNEYAGKDVRIYKGKNNTVNVLYPKSCSVVQEGHVAQAIANGTIFDDADEIDRNAMAIERTALPYNAMINGGKNTPKDLKPMIAIVIGKIGDDGSFDPAAERTNGENFIKDAVATKNEDNDNNINDVVNNYLDYDKEAPYTPDMGHMVHGLDKELDDIHDTAFEDTISDEDVVNSYDNFDIEALEKDADDIKDEDEDDDNDSDDDDSEDDDGDDKDDEPVEESTNVADDLSEANDDATVVTPTDTVEECGDTNNFEQEGFLTKKPKKLKPIGRDVVAYITCEMNDIRSANDQAMLAGYTCAKIELVDFYLTVLDTQDARYIVPHNKTYLLTMKADLERLLAQILKIRPINRSDQIWRVNYPTA